jgi:predicted AAA+ superfamily ATPase
MNNQEIVQNAFANLAPHKALLIVGPQGCGKTTAAIAAFGDEPFHEGLIGDDHGDANVLIEIDEIDFDSWEQERIKCLIDRGNRVVMCALDASVDCLGLVEVIGERRLQVCALS